MQAAWNHSIGVGINREILAKMDKCGKDLLWWNKNIFGSVRQDLVWKKKN